MYIVAIVAGAGSAQARVRDVHVFAVEGWFVLFFILVTKNELHIFSTLCASVLTCKELMQAGSSTAMTKFKLCMQGCLPVNSANCTLGMRSCSQQADSLAPHILSALPTRVLQTARCMKMVGQSKQKGGPSCRPLVSLLLQCVRSWAQPLQYELFSLLLAAFTRRHALLECRVPGAAVSRPGPDSLFKPPL